MERNAEATLPSAAPVAGKAWKVSIPLLAVLRLPVLVQREHSDRDKTTATADILGSSNATPTGVPRDTKWQCLGPLKVTTCQTSGGSNAFAILLRPVERNLRVPRLWAAVETCQPIDSIAVAVEQQRLDCAKDRSQVDCVVPSLVFGEDVVGHFPAVVFRVPFDFSKCRLPALQLRLTTIAFAPCSLGRGQ